MIATIVVLGVLLFGAVGYLEWRYQRLRRARKADR